ncbi:MAG: prepilin peptidase, partial [Gammaproteobacteria bacterium]|nr:prepilin peptidase [Gammaproteobacteria bacterium]
MEALRLLEHSLPFLLFATAMLGLLVGSFLNVVIHRVPVMMERAWLRELYAQQDADQRTPADESVYN